MEKRNNVQKQRYNNLQKQIRQEIRKRKINEIRSQCTKIEALEQTYDTFEHSERQGYLSQIQ